MCEVTKITRLKHVNCERNIDMEFNVTCLENGQEYETLLYVSYYPLFCTSNAQDGVKFLFNLIDNDHIVIQTLFVRFEEDYNKSHSINFKDPLFDKIVDAIKDNRERIMIEASL